MPENKPRPSFGILHTPDIKLHRKWFIEMCKFYGHNCIYRAPKPNKKFDRYGDLESNYLPGIEVSCIFDEYPDQKSLHKAGWMTELAEGSSIIHVPYDLNLEYGALFSIPSGLDNVPPRLFRVLKLSNISIYPASIACEIGPEFEDLDRPHLIDDFNQDTQVVLVDLEGDD